MFAEVSEVLSPSEKAAHLHVDVFREAAKPMVLFSRHAAPS